MRPFLLIIVSLFISVGAQAGVIFQDDFNTTTWSSDYLFTTDDYSSPGGWTYANGGESATFDSTTHYAGEVTSPGRGGSDDRSLKAWRHSTFYYGYDGSLEYREAAIHSYREIYHRWYMKIPSDFTLSEGSCHMNYLKLWRYFYDVDVGGASNMRPIYVNFNGSSFTSAGLAIYAIGDTWRSLVSVSEIQDGNWHCYELRIKLNTGGSSDGEIQFWLDGVEKAEYTGLAIGAASNEYFSRAGLGLGDTEVNVCTPEGEFQSTWRAIEFDDFVLSTEYVGPDGFSAGRGILSSGGAGLLSASGFGVLVTE